MAVTLRQIADQLGVSVSTVSFALNGRAGELGISTETVTKVKATAKRLHYRPSGSARALLRGRTDCIGILSIRESTLLRFELYVAMFEQISSVAHRHDVNIMVFTFDPQKPEIPKMIRERHIDGLILPYYTPQVVVNELGAAEIPVVFVNADCPSHASSVNADDAGGMKLAVEHLVHLGHRRILYLNKWSPQPHPSLTTRFDAFCQTLRGWGLIPFPGSESPLTANRNYLSAHPNLRSPGGFLGQILNLPPDQRPTAMISYSAMWLRPIMLAVQKAGLRVPHDISLICCDQTNAVTQWIPRITHLEVPAAEMGRAATEMLFNKIRCAESPAASRVIPEKLAILESTSAPPKTGH